MTTDWSSPETRSMVLAAAFGLTEEQHSVLRKTMIAAIADAVEAEREACAKMCEDAATAWDREASLKVDEDGHLVDEQNAAIYRERAGTLQACAQEIRDRGNEGDKR